MKHAICRRCLKNFKKQIGLGKFCSMECKSFGKQKRCKICLEFENHEVEFKDNSRHIKRICKVCRIGNFVPKHEAKNVICGDNRFSDSSCSKQLNMF